MTADVTEVCVVCGRRAMCKDVKGRKSGFKCKKCVGTPSHAVLKALAVKVREHTEVFRQYGWGHGQPVEWVDADEILRGIVVCNTESGWTEPRTEKVNVRLDVGDTNRVFPIDARRLIPVVTGSLLWADAKRSDTKHLLEPPSGEKPGLRYVPVVKGVSQGTYEWAQTLDHGAFAQPNHLTQRRRGRALDCEEFDVTQLVYAPGTHPTVLFPELPATAGKNWLPPERPGWRSHRCFLWLLGQVAAAAGVQHDLPDMLPQPKA